MSTAQIMTTSMFTVTRARQHYEQLEDALLVLACQDNNPMAFEALVRRHSPTVMHLIFRLAPEWLDKADISQEVLFRVWRALPRLKEPRAFKAWLKSIVTNIFYNELRKRRLTFSLDESLCTADGDDLLSKDIPDHHPAPDELYARRELQHALHLGMSKLPEHYRKAIVLREVVGYSYEEIAAKIHVEKGTVKSRISRAKKQLRECVEPFGDQVSITSQNRAQARGTAA